MGNDQRIYLINDDFPLSSTRSAVKSRIASLQAGGGDLRNLWEDPQDSFRYPVFHGDQMFWSRFSADGREQTVWQAGSHGKAEPVLSNALRIVHPAANSMYYLYKDNLRWKHRESDSDLILVSGVLSADASGSF
jgi:hypothetical protein